MKLSLLDQAKADLDAVANGYNQRQHGVGEEFLAAATMAMKAIEADPLRFAKIERPRTRREIRQHCLEGFPFSVIYERIDTGFVVLTIAHAELDFDIRQQLQRGEA